MAVAYGIQSVFLGDRQLHGHWGVVVGCSPMRKRKREKKKNIPVTSSPLEKRHVWNINIITVLQCTPLSTVIILAI